MPSAALVQMRPSMSRRKPSNRPAVQSAKTLPPESLFLAPTLKTLNEEALHNLADAASMKRFLSLLDITLKAARRFRRDS